MVTTGFPQNSGSRKTEVFNLAGQDICLNLEDFPISLFGAVGAHINGTPVVCGGYDGSKSLNKCYHFINGNWAVTTTMRERRWGATSIVYNNRMHIMGGWNDGGRLASTEILDGNGSEEGPDLPIAIFYHAITKVNQSTSIISGGSTSAASYSDRTWYYNHETQSFVEGPQLIHPRNRHGSGTIIDTITNALLPVVTGGYDGHYTDTTEILIDNQWQPGKIHCPKK